MNCLSEYAYFAKIAHLLCRLEGASRMYKYIVWLNSCFYVIIQLIKEAELAVNGRWFIPLTHGFLSHGFRVGKINQCQSIFKYSLKQVEKKKKI